MVVKNQLHSSSDVQEVVLSTITMKMTKIKKQKIAFKHQSF
jgi:hypothetical protein